MQLLAQEENYCSNNIFTLYRTAWTNNIIHCELVYTDTMLLGAFSCNYRSKAFVLLVFGSFTIISCSLELFLVLGSFTIKRLVLPKAIGPCILEFLICFLLAGWKNYFRGRYLLTIGGWLSHSPQLTIWS